MNRIRKIAQGDTEALRELYEQHKTRVYRLALSLSGDPYLAEDITQDTFLRIQERADAYAKDAGETAWIVTIARNLTYDRLRRRSREICGGIRAGDYDVSFSRPLSSQAKGCEDAAGDLYFLDLLERLHPEEKEVVTLRILGDLSWSEIGRILGQTKDACRKRYERALLRLRKQLERQ